MTTSDIAYVWVWLPGATDPVVAGAIRMVSPNTYGFAYGRSYLSRDDAISLYAPELPLIRGTQDPPEGLKMASALRDGAPDAWGRRIVYEAVTGSINRNSDVDSLDELTYLLSSGSDRIGALDFQLSPTEYIHRGDPASLEELHNAADAVDRGEKLRPALDRALIHGTSIGGARPKALLDDPSGRRGWVAKFSSSSDVRPAVGYEAAAMHLASKAGLNVPEIRVIRSLGKDVLLVRRFDRTDAGHRRMMVSGLTLAGEDENFGRYVTYPQLVDVLRMHSQNPETVGPEMFRRIVFNIAVSNVDDHARNHAAFWDGRHLELTPAYDLDPQIRSGETAAQAMSLSDVPLRDRDSTFANAVRHSHFYGLSSAQARDMVDEVVQAIRDSFRDATDFARLTRAQSDTMWGRQVLNPGSVQGW